MALQTITLAWNPDRAALVQAAHAAAFAHGVALPPLNKGGMVAAVEFALRALVCPEGARLYLARRAAGIGRKRFARLMGYDHHAPIWQMERGLRPLSAEARAWLADRS